MLNVKCNRLARCFVQSGKAKRRAPRGYYFKHQPASAPTKYLAYCFIIGQSVGRAVGVVELFKTAKF